MSQQIRWKNCYGDIVATRFGLTAQCLLDEVVEPGLDVLEARVAALNEEEDQLLVAFVMLDRDLLNHATCLGYCLAIQSLWERQLRSYLQACAKDLKVPGAFERAKASKWTEVEALFEELRGAPLAAFAEYPDLSLLHLLGNVCRHGEGASLEKLYKSHPELWPSRLPWSDVPPPPEWSFVPTVDGLEIDRALLRQLVNAIVSFWEEADCLYMENFTTYHPSALKRRDELRVIRAGRRAKLA
ncbi:hypothetical protein GNX71_28965 [Variovorax sp. RKNM96]|uniref:hypothetical protein n=1 Tax=Variovorax sp. RKNM96 TaxID=2681552 RepID=UPI00197F6E1F|nr:hypothetical protein [Variovorax sp. RKNM96]QSI33382.1 hypothetical protein GNX71_28965 [Variovorax sp. RKNM96]